MKRFFDLYWRQNESCAWIKQESGSAGDPWPESHVFELVKRGLGIQYEHEMSDDGQDGDYMWRMVKPGYHLDMIKKGELGRSSKILEEVQELIDAEEQGVRVMQLAELSDIVGAIKAYLRKNFHGINLVDLEKMADVTWRAFENGRRK